ncbi:MAG: DALR anticodon-binding domain-containing protein [bacterium]|nr:DALR anticodon-binding domain-containing protein [bacterium]
MQYTYARCRSILRQAGKPSLKAVPVVLSLEEERILRLVYRFPEVVEKAAESFSPNMVAAFAVDLAQAYNLFYSKHRVLQAENKEARNFRLQLTEGTAQILQNSLRLLGIRTLEKM